MFRRRNYTPEERDLDKENAMVWNIPVLTLTEGQAFTRYEHAPRLWMSSRTALLENASLGDSYLVVNPEETGWPCCQAARAGCHALLGLACGVARRGVSFLSDCRIT